MDSSETKTRQNLLLTHKTLPMWRDYFELCKPKVVALMLVTAIVGMLLAPVAAFSWIKIIFANIGIALAAASAATINHMIDRHFDAIMRRTHKRPIPKGRIRTKQAIIFAITMASASMAILWCFVNELTAILSLFSLIGYALFYTIFLKHKTPQNIVIGGATGAAPPLLGWTAMTGTPDANAWLLMLIIFVWTPPHFWALAIHRVNEYSLAKIPMLPVTHGIAFTKLCITLYTFLLLAVTCMPFVIGMSGIIYLCSALVLGIIFIIYALKLQFGKGPLLAINTFKYSSIYLLLLFLALLLDRFLPILISQFMS